MICNAVDGYGLESPAAWKQENPHIMTDVNALRHESVDKMWSGDNKGIVKGWDLNEGREFSEIVTGSGWMTALEVWGRPGVICCSHSNGIAYIDSRAGKIARQQVTKNPVGRLCMLNQDSPVMFGGIGPELMQYDTRMFVEGAESKPKAVAQWTLSANVTALHCTPTRKGHLLIGVGCLDGKVAAFDTS